MIECSKCRSNDVIGFVRTNARLSVGFEKFEFRCKNCINK